MKKKILVIDDDALVLKSVRNLLTNEGYEVECAKNEGRAGRVADCDVDGDRKRAQEHVAVRIRRRNAIGNVGVDGHVYAGLRLSVIGLSKGAVVGTAVRQANNGYKHADRGPQSGQQANKDLGLLQD